jgi:hypothetical protein
VAPCSSIHARWPPRCVMQGTREVVVKVAGDQVEAAQEVFRLMHPGTQVEQKASAQMLAQVGGESGSGGVGGVGRIRQHAGLHDGAPKHAPPPP